MVLKSECEKAGLCSNTPILKEIAIKVAVMSISVQSGKRWTAGRFQEFRRFGLRADRSNERHNSSRSAPGHSVNYDSGQQTLVYSLSWAVEWSRHINYHFA
jgi:hypothetical protein